MSKIIFFCLFSCYIISTVFSYPYFAGFHHYNSRILNRDPNLPSIDETVDTFKNDAMNDEEFNGKESFFFLHKKSQPIEDFTSDNFGMRKRSQPIDDQYNFDFGMKKRSQPIETDEAMNSFGMKKRSQPVEDLDAANFGMKKRSQPVETDFEVDFGMRKRSQPIELQEDASFGMRKRSEQPLIDADTPTNFMLLDKRSQLVEPQLLDRFSVRANQ